jgi:hypothetical protein
MHADADRLDERGITPNKTPRKTTGRLSPKVLAIGVAVVLVVIGAAWFIFSDKNKVPELFDDPRDQSGLPPIDADPAETVLDAAAPQPLATDSELAPVQRPQALDGSDKQVGQALQDLSPALLQWFTPDEQIRKWVLMVVNMADGTVVNKHRPVRYPMKSFKTKQTVGRTTMNPVNYERVKPLVGAVLTIPPEKLAAYYRQWSPVLTNSFTELGLEGTFHGHFLTVLDKIVDAQTHEASPSLDRPNVLFEYADPVLENASDVEKLLWRMGPANMAEVQAYAATLKAAL